MQAQLHGEGAAGRRRALKVSLDLGEEREDPAVFRDCAALAERLGFEEVWLGDHFMPWVDSHGRSAAVWPLMGACLERTSRVRVGPLVTTPIGGRYHPAVVAQAAATLESMYPGRFLLGVGSGEGMNERPFMKTWPSWSERMERLTEGIALMRRLWESESFFDFEGRYFAMSGVRLYTRSSGSIPVYFSAVGPRASYLAGRHGDHLVTMSSRNPLERIRDVIFPSFERGVRDAGKTAAAAEKVVSLSYTFESEREFLASARGHAMGRLAKGALDEPDPRRIEEMDGEVPEERLLASTVFCSGWDDLLEAMARLQRVGATCVCLPTGPNPGLIREYAEKILPHFLP